MLTVVIFLLILSILVFVHELGHFVVARKMGTKVYEFGIGFPPRAIAFYKNKEGKLLRFRKGQKVEELPNTLYSLNWIPLGGFVRIKGEDGEVKDNDPDNFLNKKIWQKTFILAAGVTMNFLLAGFLLSIGFMIGLPQAVSSSNNNFIVKNPQIQIYEVKKDSPASKAGLKEGDIVERVDGYKFDNIEKLSDYISKKDGQEVNLVIKRGKEREEKKIVPINDEKIGRALLGVSLMKTGLVSYPWYQAIYMGFLTALKLTVLILKTFYGMLVDLIRGVKVKADVAGPVGIAVLTGQMVKLGFIYVLQFTALLSLNLAIINFLPIPALDGGKVLFLIIEKLRGRPMNVKIENMIHTAGFAILMLLVVVVTFYDLAKFKTVFIGLWGKISGFF